MSEARRSLVIAGAGGSVGATLAQRLAATWSVRSVRRHAASTAERWQADLTSIPETEVALAAAHTVVMLARAPAQPARLFQGSLDDVDALMADSVARAVERVGARHIVLWSTSESDAREAPLRRSRVPLSVVRAGSDVDAIEALTAAIETPGDKHLATSTDAPRAVKPVDGATAISLQRYPRPSGATAQSVAEAYFEWLPSAVPLTHVERIEQTWRIHVGGTPVLVLQHDPGRSEPDSFVLNVVGGALPRVTQPPSRFEFRALRDDSMLVALMGFTPALPWAAYRFGQAVMHARVMRLFGEALGSLRFTTASSTH